VSDLNGIVSPAYSVFEFIDSTPKYFHYLFRTDQYTSEFKRNSTGVIESRLRMYDDTFLRLKSHFPPLLEQQQIVTYLDQKTTLIDQIISGSEKKIELLKEQRTATINHAVTKGLNPKVKMKDSGVEWIGEIPEGWEISPLRFLYQKIGSGITPRGGSEVYVEDGVIFIRSQNVHFEGLRLDDVVKIVIKKSSNSPIEFLINFSVSLLCSPVKF
jgi:type I restriction enzyme S subunit